MKAAGLVHTDVPLPRGSFTPERYHKGAIRLVQAVQELSLARDLPTIQRIVRKAARELTNCDGATFVLRDENFCYYADEDAIEPLWKGKRFPMEICVSGWVMIHRRPTAIPDIYKDPRIPYEAYRPTFVKSLVMVPIRSLDPIGAIGNYWGSLHEPTVEEIELLQSLADSTAIAMENVRVFSELEDRVQIRTAELQQAKKEIEQLSVTDELTGLNNRRGFYLKAEQAMALSARKKETCALVFLDLDGLKAINDSLGHDAGDAMITDMAAVLRTSCRESDVVARLGGDEFCVLLLNASADNESFAQRLHTGIEQLNQSNQRSCKLSASIGITYTNPAEAVTLDELLSRADKLMYADKRTKPDPSSS